MAIDPAIISSTSALLGALAGGGASLAAAVYTQRYQDRLQRIARESTKRETIYAEFIMTASTALLNAYVEDGLTLGQDKQQLIGVLQRMRLFAPPVVIAEADKVLQSIVEIALQPVIDLRGLTAADLAKRREANILEAFSTVCRSDLDGLYLKIR
jgi:hypothetical protein